MPLLRRLLLLLVLFSCATPTLAAQASPPRTVYAPGSALLQVSPDPSLYCRSVIMEYGHRTMGIVRMFEFQLPLTGRVGLLGFAADSSVRYLAVSLNFSTLPYGLRHAATIHFTRSGAVEIGRQVWEELRSDSLPQRQVYGLSADEASSALALARHLAARCR